MKLLFGARVVARASMVAGGADRDVADRLWRALGFPDVPEGKLAFTDEDARALRLATEGLAPLTSDRREQALELMLHEARVISARLANLAELELDAIGALIKLGLRRGRHPAGTSRDCLRRSAAAGRRLFRIGCEPRQPNRGPCTVRCRRCRRADRQVRPKRAGSGTRNASRLAAQGNRNRPTLASERSQSSIKTDRGAPPAPS
jgi:hypothetical protein